MMTFTQLNYFCTACQMNSITRAAEHFYVTQPAITSAIREMEKEYHVVLLERKGRGLQLTEEGRIFLKSAEALLKHANDIDRQLRDLAQQKAYVRLGITKSVGSNTYTQYLPYGIHLHPEIDIATHSGSSIELLSELRSHRLDVILIPSQSVEKLDDLCCIPLKKTQMLYCMSEKHPLADVPVLTVPMIVDEKMISTCRDENKVHALGKLFRKSGYSEGPIVIQRFEQLNTALAMIRQNMGTGYFPEEGIQGFTGIVGKPIEGDEPICVYAVTEKGANDREDIRRFLSGMLGFFRGNANL